MDLMTADEFASCLDYDSDEVFWQMMKHLELDLEAKRCILPVFAHRFLATPSYSTLVTAFKYARRFLVRTDPTFHTLFKTIRNWFKMSHLERTTLCRNWMVR